VYYSFCISIKIINGLFLPVIASLYQNARGIRQKELIMLFFENYAFAE
jgi:hypothetical protein